MTLTIEARIRRYNLANAELVALTAWTRGGADGPRPETPNLSALQETYVRRMARAERKAERQQELVATHKAKRAS